MTKTWRRKIKNKRRFGFVVLMGSTCSLSPTLHLFVFPDSLPVASSSNDGANTIVLQRLLNQLLWLGEVKSLRKVFNILHLCLNPDGYILMYSTN